MESTGEKFGRRLILPESVSEEAVARLAASLSGVRIRDDRQPEVDVGLVRSIAWALGPVLTLHFGIDHQTDTSFVSISSEDWSDVDEMTAVLAEYFDTRTVEQLVESAAAASGASERFRTLIQLGIGAPREPHPLFVDLLRGALTNPDALVREGAVLGAGYTRWEELLPDLVAVAERDAVERLRIEARALVGYVREHGWSG